MNNSIANGTLVHSEWTSLHQVEFVINIACSVIGIPLNVLVVVLIVCNNKRRSYHIFTVGVLFSNVHTLSTAVLNYVVNYWPSNALCFVYYSTFGSSYTLLLVNLLLATLDRWSSLAAPQWRRSNITMCRLIALQVVAYLLISIIIGIPYIARIVPLQCGIHIQVLKWMAFVDCPLMATCIALKILLYRATKSCANREEVITSIVSLVTITIFESASSNSGQRTEDSFCRRPWRAASIEGVEREGRISLISGMISMFVFAIPSAVVFLYVWVCDDFLENCGSIDTITSSVALFWYIHAVYNCIVILVRNPQIFTAMNILRRPAPPSIK